MAQFEFVQWLVQWLFSMFELEFDWDDGNSTKSLTKHKISQERAEQVFRNRDLLVPLGIQIAPQTNEPRFGVLGMDGLGTHLTISFTIRAGRVRVISVRPMSRKERKKYAEVR